MPEPDAARRWAGLDLAARDEATGLAELTETADGAVRIETALRGVCDDAAIAAIRRADKTGVDVPVGWPAPFVARIRQHHAAGAAGEGPDGSGGTEAPGAELDGLAWRRSLTLRTTDLHVAERIRLRPLSVAADLIAHPALRWTLLDERLRAEGIDCARDGSGRIAEVYPAGALKMWGLPSRGYKASAKERGAAVRGQIITALQQRFPVLEWNGAEEAAQASDDVLDAIIAALMAREVTAGRTEPPPPSASRLVLTEGWIHLPRG